jgi:hypothetical protein
MSIGDSGASIDAAVLHTINMLSDALGDRALAVWWKPGGDADRLDRGAPEYELVGHDQALRPVVASIVSAQ